MKDTTASIAHMIAVLCMEAVRTDPEMITRLQKLARDSKAPFDAGHLDADVIELAEQAVTLVGSQLIKQQRPLAELDIPVPRVEGGLERSAGALAVGSFTTEFVHSDKERLAAFSDWMEQEHPQALEGTEIERSAIEDADQMLTLMAHVSNHLLDSQNNVVSDDVMQSGPGDDSA
jgi:hypothetical protein